jgi:hypothetical protein
MISTINRWMQSIIIVLEILKSSQRQLIRTSLAHRFQNKVESLLIRSVTSAQALGP